jgi:DNA-binding CsgD family transcriptional regulator
MSVAVRQALEPSVYVAAVDAANGLRPHAWDSAIAFGPGYNLTRREVEVLRLVAEGHSNAQLAKMLWVTERTVKFHLSNIYRKLGVSNRTEASRWALLNGLLEPAAEPAAAALAEDVAEDVAARVAS